MTRLVIVNDASIARGGATGLALMQARCMAERGIETTFVAGDREPNAELEALWVRFLNAGTDPLMKASPVVAATRGLYSRPVLNLVQRVIDEGDSPDTVYHVHSWSKTLTPSVFKALRRVAPRVFLHAHDFFYACPNGGFMDYRRMEPCSRVPLSADCIATHCDKRSYAQKLWRTARGAILSKTLPRSAPWAGMLVIHPGMARYFERSGFPSGLIHPLRNPAQAFTPERVRVERNRGVLFIGRVEAEKGVEELIAAAARAEVPLTIIGDGPLRERLTALHPDVRFTGWLDRTAIGAEVAHARCVAMPSRYPEPFGLVAAEASLSGLPVVTSEVALLGTEIAEAGIGFTCDTRDPAAFAACLGRLADMPETEIREMSRRGASGKAGLCTSADEWIDAQIALYERALSREPVSAA